VLSLTVGHELAVHSYRNFFRDAAIPREVRGQSARGSFRLWRRSGHEGRTDALELEFFAD
jgi:hypothetical protein